MGIEVDNNGMVDRGKERSPVNSLRKFGTIAFELSYMLKTIGLGEPEFSAATGEFIGFPSNSERSELNVQVWFAFVPEVYFKEVSLLTKETIDESLRGGAKANRASLIRFICDLHSNIWQRVIPK